MLLRHTLGVLICLALAPSLWAGHTLSPQQQKVLDRWLKKYPDLRVATDADCDCAQDIQQMRRGYGGKLKAIPDYHPFVTTGDFNGDGQLDFAVVLVIKSKQQDNFTLAVFNGPVSAKSGSPAFYESNLDLRGQGLFFGPPRPRPYRLVLGHFENDNSSVLSPKGRSYSWRLDVSY